MSERVEEIKRLLDSPCECQVAALSPSSPRPPAEPRMDKAERIVEYVCQWVETAGSLTGRRGQRNLSFSLIVDREGNTKPAYQAIAEGVRAILDEPASREGRRREHLSNSS